MIREIKAHSDVAMKVFMRILGFKEGVEEDVEVSDEEFEEGIQYVKLHTEFMADVVAAEFAMLTANDLPALMEGKQFTKVVCLVKRME